MLKLVLFFLLILFGLSQTQHYNHWNNDVYSGRQLDEYVTPVSVASSEIIRPALLILYEPKCASLLARERLSHASLPREQFMVLAKHDYVKYPENIWYEIDERDNLQQRYKPVNCPEYLFFKPGSTLNTPVRYDKKSGVQVRDWVWDNFEVEFSFQNVKSRDVVVEFHGRGPQISAFTVREKMDFIFKAYVSYCLIVSDAQNQKFLYGILLDENINGKVIVVDDSMKMDIDVQTWFDHIKTQLDEEAGEVRKWRWNIAEGYLMNFKQPVLLPKFTNIGYHHGKMPQKLYAALKEFYHSHIQERKEEYHSCEPLINDREVKCGFVAFDDNITQFVAETMKPLMEEWSKTELVLSALYGVREYYTGNILRNHVDLIQTHVISVILQIWKDLGGQEDWNLEIIDYQGKRKNVTLEPGEMLFYESGTLIHGRPFPYQGKVFANAFLHYRPVEGWKWHMSEDRRTIIKDGEINELVDNFPSKITYNGGHKGLLRDEL